MNFTTKPTLYICLVSTFRPLPLESIQNLSLGSTFCTRKVRTEIFGNVRCPVLRIKTNTTVRRSIGAARRPKKGRRNWKLKTSNAEDDADISLVCQFIFKMIKNMRI